MGQAILSFLEKEEKYIFDKFAKQCSGSVYLQSGNNVVLATVAIDTQEVVEEDFLPLTVQYIEKAYAAGKFPGGYIKREAKPGDFETLSARIVDRSLRPLFPKGYCYPTQITILVLSADQDADLQLLALNAASAALYVSEIPLYSPVSAVRIGKIGDNFVINPSLKQLEESSLDLFVSGVNEDLLMIEMRTFGGIKTQEGQAIFSANELQEEEMIEALEIAKNAISQKSKLFVEHFKDYIKPSLNLEQTRKTYVCQKILEYIQSEHLGELKGIIQSLSKTERHSLLMAFARKIQKEWEEKYPQDTQDLSKRTLETILKIKREIIRAMVLEESTRADGRGLKEVRPISIDTNFLPNAHSSVLFTRGQTQALVVATLGGDMDAQSYELLTDKASSKERFMVHYNFPPFSVGEASSISAPGRRELGHGNLAKRALEASIINGDMRTIRLVSEILESNGSSSMATVCGGSLALVAAGIECTSLVAGVAMGLVCENDKYAVLTDIMGLEDHDGDMDFKVAGSRHGITAMQMDIKLGGLNMQILRDANESVLPSSQIFSIEPSKIIEVIGQAGKTIKEIIEKFGVAIDLNRENGEVKVSGSNKEKVEAAKEHILKITKNLQDIYKVGDIYQGKVKKVVEFGAFVELPEGYDGLLHISKITNSRDEKASDVLSVGEMVEVEVLSLNKNKVELGLIKKL